MDRAEEQRLVRKAAGGSQAAIESLVRAHQASLFGFVVRMTGRPEVAEDVVQESFVRVILNIHRFDSRFRFSTWLFTIARRLYLNAAQKSAPGFDTDAVERGISRGDSPSGRLDDHDAADERRDYLARGLAVLSPEQREVVLLFHQHEWPIKTIADHMQIPEGTVKSHLHRARRALKDALESLAPRDPAGGALAGVPGLAPAPRGPHSSDPATRPSHQERSSPAAGPTGIRATGVLTHDPLARDLRPTLAARLVRTEVRS